MGLPNLPVCGWIFPVLFRKGSTTVNRFLLNRQYVTAEYAQAIDTRLSHLLLGRLKSSCHPNTSVPIRRAINPGKHRSHYAISLTPNPAIPLRRAVRGGSSKGPSCKFFLSLLRLAISGNPPWSLMGSTGPQLSSTYIKSSSFGVFFLITLNLFSFLSLPCYP